jgi:hypothetical protein
VTGGLAGQNVPVPIRDAAAALRALRSDDLDAVIGLRECAWLDGKEKPYKLGHPAQDAELAKDAAALANARGGLLLIGYDTARRAGREILTRLASVPGDSVNVEQYRMILRARIYPDIRGLDIEWVQADDTTGIVVIRVPGQRETDKLFVVRGRNPAEGVRVPIRDDDGTRWLEPEGVQRLLSGGWNALDRASILSLLETARRPPASPPAPAITVGRGIPGYEAAFRDAYRQAGGKAVLGPPVEEVAEYGPGAVQNFKGGPRGASGPVRAARPEDDRGGSTGVGCAVGDGRRSRSRRRACGGWLPCTGKCGWHGRAGRADPCRCHRRRG